MLHSVVNQAHFTRRRPSPFSSCAQLKLRKPGEKNEDVILRIAGRYRVAPYLVERGLFYIGLEPKETD